MDEIAVLLPFIYFREYFGLWKSWKKGHVFEINKWRIWKVSQLHTIRIQRTTVLLVYTINKIVWHIFAHIFWINNKYLKAVIFSYALLHTFFAIFMHTLWPAHAWNQRQLHESINSVRRKLVRLRLIIYSRDMNKMWNLSMHWTRTISNYLIGG